MNWKSILLWAFPVFFLNFWTATRVYAYFFQDAEWNKADFRNTVLPNDVPKSVTDGFFAVIDTMFIPGTIKFWTIRIHILIAAPMGFIAMLQLFPFLRKRNLNLHRRLGYLYVALLIPFTIEQLYTMFGVGPLPIGFMGIFGNLSSLASMVLGTGLGIYYAKQHRIKAHRACMLINAAGIFRNPVQRFFWAIFAKANLQAPYTSYPDWLDKPMAASEYAALTICYGTAALYVVMAATSTKALKARAA